MDDAACPAASEELALPLAGLEKRATLLSSALCWPNAV